MPDPFARPVEAIEQTFVMHCSRRAATKQAIARKRDEIARADADILSHERVLLSIDQQIDALFDERDRAAANDLERLADALVEQ